MQARIEFPDWARQLASDHTDMDRDPRAVDASKVSSVTLTLPDDVYYEYAFIDAEGRMRADPRNELRAYNPWYPEVSAIVGPEFRPSPYASVDDALVTGSLDRHRLESELLGSMRRLNVYTPAGQEGQSLPLLLVHDGTAFMRIGGLAGVLEALLGEGRVRPVRLAFIEPADRISEYAFNEDYTRFSREELLPFLEEEYPTNGERLLMGASLGGLMSATLALETPGYFSGLATFSGAFYGTPDDRDFYRSRDSWVLERVKENAYGALRWYLEVGTIEWLTDVNRDLAGALARNGSEHAFDERNAGHNWTSWKNGLAPALEFLLGRD